MSQLRTEIDAAIEKQGLRRKDVADRLEISQGFLSDLMSGNRNLTPGLVDAFAKALAASKACRVRWHKLGAAEAGWEVK